MTEPLTTMHMPIPGTTGAGKAPPESHPLALHGGVPVRTRMLPYARHALDEADVQAVVEALRSEWLTTGPRVEEFESAIAAYAGARHAIVFSSGTAALHAAVFAAGLGPGDEGITTPLTFCATANCLLYQGARPVFADVDPSTLTIDPADILRRITPKTKAILPMDYAGHPAQLDAILEIAGHRGLIVIEDACHALGAEDQGRRIGSLSHMTVFSFHPVKHIATGEGGAVATNDAAFAKRLRLFRNHGIERDWRIRQAEGQWHYDMTALGYNYRLSDLNCALGISQLKKTDGFLARRRAIAARYTTVFQAHQELVAPTVSAGINPAWHLYPVRLVPERLMVDRGAIFKALRAENIGVNVHYIPVHLHPYYQKQFGYRAGDFPMAEGAYERLISLPMFPSMIDEDIEDVIAAVRKVLRYYAQE